MVLVPVVLVPVVLVRVWCWTARYLHLFHGEMLAAVQYQHLLRVFHWNHHYLCTHVFEEGDMRAAVQYQHLPAGMPSGRLTLDHCRL